MKRKLNILTYLYTLFLVLLFLSGQFSGIIGDLIYLLSFALAIYYRPSNGASLTDALLLQLN